ncbi:PTS fructose transporter subunit IIA [Pseudoxanthomonas yeongjuensis]|uniref:PTS sugar transporter subunit IIA n=1 Tax=Pseudoxanthomonas yeongjuensis TaxID=377616 RepID=UPI001390B483|nr:PTS sugar transporter subunit IIA [Pseudoxanthomonas yeongjuensis]KAF1718518.1 PTS fructose transporter subunit IIA [Pseudoxanthomonas yeongjuensis]
MSLADQLADVQASVLNAVDRDAVLDAAAGMLACRQAGADDLRSSLQARERLGSTAIGHGIAIPHGRSPTLEAPRGALLRLQPAVDFNASDGQNVDLVFAMAVPDHYTHQHLMLLSELAERFSDERFRAALRNAPDARAMRALLLDQTPSPETRA